MILKGREFRGLMSLNGPEVSLAKDFHSQRNVKTLVPSSTEHHVVSVVLSRKKTIKLLSFNAIRLRSHRQNWALSPITRAQPS